jgi:hypothetical protein
LEAQEDVPVGDLYADGCCDKLEIKSPFVSYGREKIKTAGIHEGEAKTTT